MSFADKLICLCLNKLWIPVDQKTGKEAVSDLFSGNFKAVNIHHNEENEAIMQVLDWDGWINLKIKKEDPTISSKHLTIKIPTVIITNNYSKIPFMTMSPNAKNIRIRDKSICQYTNKKLTPQNFSIDHVIPKCRGGRDTWENMVSCDIEINLMKGSRTPEEAGLKLIKKPTKPTTIPYKVHEALHPTWGHFLI
jgi:5-methylcytosine-specific restriction endonuclease McrA